MIEAVKRIKYEVKNRAIQAGISRVYEADIIWFIEL